MITEQQFTSICPKADPDLVPHLLQTLDEFHIDNPLRIAAFIAQLAHESGEFTRTEENLNYSAERLLQVFRKYYPTKSAAANDARNPEKIANRVYANRLGNGPAESGDGWLYRGRGYIQLTGRYNYKTFGKLLALDLEETPELAKESKDAFRIAGAFWNRANLNVKADAKDFISITRGINGGTIGLEDRQKYYRRALDILV
ncbi:MAG: glycoside hydrolase family 19 protein [Nitrosopumilaceae archaeon]